MPMYVKDGGVWKPAVQYGKVGGVWKPAVPKVRVGGVWRELLWLTTAVTSATSGGGFNGYENADFGSIAADTYQDLSGAIRQVFGVYRDGSTLVLHLTGTVPDSNNSFSVLQVQNSAGGTHSVSRSARFNYSTFGGLSQWIWNSTPTTVFPAGNAGPWTVRVF